MITPPPMIGCFYTVMFKRPVTDELMKLMAPKAGGDIEHVLLTSLDMTSDLLAMHEMRTGINIVTKGTSLEFDQRLSVNPLYLPMAPDELATIIEINKAGEIQMVAGFTNPFISMHLELSTEERPDAIDGKVCYEQFELPRYTELIENRALLS